MNDTEALTEAERDIMLTRCGCGHTINDHGSLGHCWACLDDEREDCPHDFEDLLAGRVARIVAARVAAARADAERRDKELADYLAQMDRAGGGIYTRDFREGFRHALAMLAAYGSEEAPSPDRVRPEVREAARQALALRAAVADPEPPAPWCPECGPTCPLHGEPPNTCPSCALGQHRCTRDLAPCDCRECA